MRILFICLVSISVIFAVSTSISAVTDKNNIGTVKVEKVEPLTIPGKINIQGYLTNASGTPITGSHNISFTIYRDGSPAWGPESQSVSVTNGLFSAVLGNTSTIGSSVFQNGTTFELEVSVDGSTLSPRIGIMSSPFSICSIKSDTATYASNADMVDYQHASSFAPNSGSQNYINVSGNVTQNNMAILTGGGQTTLHSHPSSGITSINSMTGPAISVSGGTGISISNSSNTVTVTNSSPFPGFSGSGSSSYASRSDHTHSDYVLKAGDHMTGNLYMDGAYLNIRNSSGTSRGVIRPGDPSYSGLELYLPSDLAILYFQSSRHTGSDWIMSVDGYSGEVDCHHDFYVDGYKGFRQPHPTDPSKEIIYTCLEGGESGTYWRGHAQLTNGVGIISLPEHFSLVTAKDNLTAQVTPCGDCKGLCVESVSTSKLVVKELQGGISNVSFDYLVQGVRLGYENMQVIRDKINRRDGSVMSR